ncbi:uncharacterized protein LOC124703018 [Lolium rigidum]|uniref:uncharacterized protein LOC124703018 n=1 Tax=Lolium rigidum TaxID=89674 RepID=UPI001F5DC2A4|nr:uncharacterized protein LOC124703018 [Lolium rigidum]
MAECSLATLRGQYRGGWSRSSGKLSPKTISIRISKRNCIHNIHLPCLPKFNSAKERKSGAFTSSNFHGKGYKLRTEVRCYFFQSLMGSESLISPNLMLLSDEALLTISIIFAYLAGVTPSRPTGPRTTSPSANQHLAEPISSDSGRNVEQLLDRTAGFDPNDTWSEVRAKLSEALEANGQDASFDRREDGLRNDRKNYPLSMLAIHGGPRLRLLLITFQLLEMEARNISGSFELLDGIRWSEVSICLIDSLIEPAFMKWIEDEQALEKSKIDKELMMVISRKIKEDDGILKRFTRLGKAELYLDLLFFIRFGSARSDSYFDAKFLAQNGARILEDLVIFLADVIASIYLEIMSVDGDMPTEVVGSSLALCSLSTRQLQKQRNEVAINGWLHQYFESVVSMYEDRFELYVLRRRACDTPVDNQSERTNWFRLAFQKPSASNPMDYVCISPFSLPVRRTKELRALTGWRYYYSLVLELSDIALPFARVVVARVSAAVSYFWVSMIGRSLGLIFSGIRQSLGWR